MGRGTYEYFADVYCLNRPGHDADVINAVRKYVFSSTLENADWNNSTLIRDDVVNAVTELKQEDGGDLMMYGYGRLNQTLLADHLVDEIRFSIHPVLVGGGTAGGGSGKTLPLKLLGATPAPSGVVALDLERLALELSGKARRGHKPAGPQPHPRTTDLCAPALSCRRPGRRT